MKDRISQVSGHDGWLDFPSYGLMIDWLTLRYLYRSCEIARHSLNMPVERVSGRTCPSLSPFILSHPRIPRWRSSFQSNDLGLTLSLIESFSRDRQRRRLRSSPCKPPPLCLSIPSFRPSCTAGNLQTDRRMWLIYYIARATHLRLRRCRNKTTYFKIESKPNLTRHEHSITIDALLWPGMTWFWDARGRIESYISSYILYRTQP